VISRSPFIPGCVVRARPIGVLKLEDELAATKSWSACRSTRDLPLLRRCQAKPPTCPRSCFQQIEHFFTHYKDLEAEKWVRVGKWGDAAEARKITIEAIERYQAGK
jgi:inorganic pyrophosphatase